VIAHSIMNAAGILTADSAIKYDPAKAALAIRMATN